MNIFGFILNWILNWMVFKRYECLNEKSKPIKHPYQTARMHYWGKNWWKRYLQPILTTTAGVGFVRVAKFHFFAKCKNCKTNFIPKKHKKIASTLADESGQDLKVFWHCQLFHKNPFRRRSSNGCHKNQC